MMLSCLVWVPVFPKIVKYLGVFWKALEQPHAICVGICKRKDGFIGIVHLEIRRGKLDESWAKGVGEQLEIKSIPECSSSPLKDYLKRQILLNLRNALTQHRLLIPNRYIQLIDELFDYSYMKPPEGYVLALALALDNIQS